MWSSGKTYSEPPIQTLIQKKNNFIRTTFWKGRYWIYGRLTYSVSIVLSFMDKMSVTNIVQKYVQGLWHHDVIFKRWKIVNKVIFTHYIIVVKKISSFFID